MGTNNATADKRPVQFQTQGSLHPPLGRERGAPGTARARGSVYTSRGEAMLGGASGRQHSASRQVPGEAAAWRGGRGRPWEPPGRAGPRDPARGRGAARPASRACARLPALKFKFERPPEAEPDTGGRGEREGRSGASPCPGLRLFYQRRAEPRLTSFFFLDSSHRFRRLAIDTRSPERWTRLRR